MAPYDPNKGENADKQNKKNKRMMSASDKYKSEREKKEKEEKKINMYNKIILGLARHLSLSKKIISFSLYMFTLNQKLCEFLSQALVENKSLKIVVNILFMILGYIIFSNKGFLFSFPICDFIFYIIYIALFIKLDIVW